MTGVGLVPTELASLVVETLLTGVCVVLSFAVIYVLLSKPSSHQGFRFPAKQFNKAMFGVSVVLICTVLAVRICLTFGTNILLTQFNPFTVFFLQHWLVDVCRAFDAFIYHAESPGPNDVFANLADPKSVLKTAIFAFQGFLGNVVLVSGIRHFRIAKFDIPV